MYTLYVFDLSEVRQSSNTQTDTTEERYDEINKRRYDDTTEELEQDIKKHFNQILKKQMDDTNATHGLFSLSCTLLGRGSLALNGHSA